MASKKSKKVSRKSKVGVRRFNVDFPVADMNAFRKFAKAKELTMAEWARGVLRKASGR